MYSVRTIVQDNCYPPCRHCGVQHAPAANYALKDIPENCPPVRYENQNHYEDADEAFFGRWTGPF